MTPEGRVKKMVKKALDQFGPDCWRFMPVQSGYGSPALDYLLSIHGHFVAIETKAPGKKLTPLQESTKAAIEAAGGHVFIVWDESSLALALKIMLTLEFENSGTERNEACLRAIGKDPKDTHISAANEETERFCEQHGLSSLLAKKVGAAVGRHHGASGKAPARQPEPGEGGEDQ